MGTIRTRRWWLAIALTALGCGPDTADTGAERPEAGVWREGPRLPQPITNNAVAATTVDGATSLFSFGGMDSTKAWSGVTNAAYRWDMEAADWRAIAPVPGPGRLAATAQVVDSRIYLMGGYTVAEDGSEKSLPDVAVYDPVTESWSRGADIPVPTDDAVAGVGSGGLIYLVSGWHDSGNVADVQIYDPERDSWTAGSPIEGAPVFGHTGAIAAGTVVYAGGAAVVDARPRFQIDSTAWAGEIDATRPESIRWRRIPTRPGPPLYRAAGGVLGNAAIFIGGTDNPYNYTGVGYDGVPAIPLREILTYDPRGDRWGRLEALPMATMDHRNAPVAGGRIFVVGGMLADQIVSDRVWSADVEALLATTRGLGLDEAR